MDELRQHIRRYCQISDAELSAMAPYFSLQTFRKRELLLKEEERCDRMFFVEKGCVCVFFTKDNGQEQVVDFAIEQWWTTDFGAFLSHSKSRLGIKAVEPCTVLVLTRTSKDKLLRDFPQMEQYFRTIAEKAYSAAQHRIRLLYELSREQAYFYFRDKFPEFVQRVPQYLLASFLGFTPEYLSEIRKRAFLKRV